MLKSLFSPLSFWNCDIFLMFLAFRIFLRSSLTWLLILPLFLSFYLISSSICLNDLLPILRLENPYLSSKVQLKCPLFKRAFMPSSLNRMDLCACLPCPYFISTSLSDTYCIVVITCLHVYSFLYP